MGLHFAVAEKPNQRRIKVLSIEATLFLHLLRSYDGTRLIRTSDIPEDARCIGLTVDKEFNTISLYVESREFEQVPESLCWPHLDVIFTSYHPEVVEPDKLLFTVGEDVVRAHEERMEKLVKEIANVPAD